ncbi:MAG: CvpA family protein [Steroidobacteraceae bacterium]
MTVLDYIILGVVLFSAVAGVIRGFLREVCSLVTWILAFWLAWHFGPALEPHLGGALSSEPARTWAARIPIFILVLMVGAAIGALLNHLVRVSLFSGLDRLLGFVLGVLRGLVILGVAAMIGHAVRLDGESWWRGSRLAPYVESVANGLRSIAGEEWVERATSRFGNR